MQCPGLKRILSSRPATSPCLKDQTIPLSPCDEDPPELQLPAPLFFLTENNLHAHTQQTNPSEQPIDVMTETASTATRAQKSHDTRERLRTFGVVLDSEKAFPPPLDIHIRNVLGHRRQDIGSPSVKNMSDRANELQLLKSELTVMRILCPELMFCSATETDGEEYTYWDQESRLAPAYVTRVEEGERITLSKPIADACNGYIRRDIAQTSLLSLACPFTEDEEAKLTKDPGLPPVLLDVLVPFLTAQLKTLLGDGLLIAKYQAARDGSAMCEYLHRLFTRGKVEFSAVDTCHWSVTCDTDTVRLYVHWHEAGPRYHMKELDRAPLKPSWEDPENKSLRRMRDRLRNIQEHAVKGRLQRIKTALETVPVPAPLSMRSPSKKGASKQQTDEGFGSEAPSSGLNNRSNMTPPGGNDPFRNKSDASNNTSNRAQLPGLSPISKPTALRRSERPRKPNPRYSGEAWNIEQDTVSGLWILIYEGHGWGSLLGVIKRCLAYGAWRALYLHIEVTIR